MKRLLVVLMVCICYLFSFTSAFADITAAVGSSIDPSEKKAVKEILNKVGISAVQNADICVVFFNANYDAEKISKELNKAVHSPIWGATSSNATMTPNGYELGGISMLFLSGEGTELDVSLGAAELGDSRASAVSAGKMAAEKATDMIDTPQVILVTSAPGMEEAIIEGIELVVGKNIPVLGGSSADNTVEGNWKQLMNDKVYNHAVVVAAISTNKKIGYDFAHGYLPVESDGKSAYIKSSSEYGRLLEGLGERGALDLYAEWIETSPEELEGMNLLGRSLLSPIAVSIRKNDKDFYILAHPAIGSSGEDNGTMFCFKELPTGSKVTLMEAGEEQIISSLGHSLDEAKNGIEGEDIAAVILVHCAGRMFAVGDEAMESVFNKVHEKIGEATPFITFFPFGEQGANSIIGNTHGNLCVVPFIISK